MLQVPSKFQIPLCTKKKSEICTQAFILSKRSELQLQRRLHQTPKPPYIPVVHTTSVLWKRRKIRCCFVKAMIAQSLRFIGHHAACIGAREPCAASDIMGLLWKDSSVRSCYCQTAAYTVNLLSDSTQHVLLPESTRSARERYRLFIYSRLRRIWYEQLNVASVLIQILHNTTVRTTSRHRCSWVFSEIHNFRNNVFAFNTSVKSLFATKHQ